MANRRGRPSKRVIISPSERATLEQWVRRRSTAQGLALRARIVLACTVDRTDVDIARELRVHRLTVGEWRRRFQRARLDGLLDEPRPGAPRRISDADGGARDHARPSKRRRGMRRTGAPASMAKATGMSQSAVARIWKAFALQPHRVETFKLSKDPLFIEKVRDIVGLYLAPPGSRAGAVRG